MATVAQPYRGGEGHGRTINTHHRARRRRAPRAHLVEERAFSVARHIHVEFRDDLDPDRIANQTVRFSLDGRGYEIDLSDDNAERLRTTVGQWSACARRQGKTASGSSRGKRGATSTRADRAQLQAMRTWARTNGYQVSDRGRIPQHIAEAYHRQG